MLRSMTGFARAEAINSTKKCVAEIRTLNHRFLEISIRVPSRDHSLDSKIKELISSKIKRGYVELSLTLGDSENSKKKLVPDEEMIKQYIAAANKVKEMHPIKGDLDLLTILQLKDIFKYPEEETDLKARWELIKKAMMPALDQLIEMREAEGASLKKDILEKLAQVESHAESIFKIREKEGKSAAEKIKAKIEAVIGDYEVDPQRILTEAAILSERADVSEEVTRLESHIEQMRKHIADGGPIGRKIEFMLQEMNRETNTIGSKSTIYDISHHVVEIKSEIEKIREQAANIE